MRTISAQVSVYGLGGTDTAAAIRAFLGVLDEQGIRYESGTMSTVAWGDQEAIWQALREGYQAASDLGPAVMQITVSNACPLPAIDEASV
ncbi:MAG: YkoF family thiamine/hydroxymethylpyrimidine-binding protein [Anaerolineae bacterium]